MTVDQIIRETRQWPANQVEALVDALKAQVDSSEVSAPGPNAEAASRLHDLSQKIDVLWAGTNRDIGTDEMIASLRESRSRRE